MVERGSGYLESNIESEVEKELYHFHSPVHVSWVKLYLMISICFRHNTMVLYVPFLDGKHGEVLLSFLIPPFSLKVLHLVVVFCSCSVMEREEREENERQKTEEWVVGWAAKGRNRKRWNGANSLNNLSRTINITGSQRLVRIVPPFLQFNCPATSFYSDWTTSLWCIEPVLIMLPLPFSVVKAL